MSFTITVTDICGSATLTANALGTTSYTYAVGATALSISIPAFTNSQASCTLTYSIVDATNTANAGPSFITIAQPGSVGGNPTVSVSTSSTGDVGTYTVKIKGEITGHATPAYSEALTIVVDLCTGVTLTTSSISDVTRDISESYTHNIVTLSWA